MCLPRAWSVLWARCLGSQGPSAAPGTAALWESQKYTKPVVGLTFVLARLAFRQFPAAAPCWAAPGIPGPRKVAGADILGTAGGVGRRAIWKFPGLKEHLCNCFRGEVWTMD